MLFDDRLMAVANFGTGKLYPLSYNDPKPQLTEMQLPRLIENPDGMGLAPDGALIVLENAIQSGQGRILRIPSPKAAGMHRIEILREGMESPVNLTIPPQGCAFVSESRIRHRLLPGHETEVPTASASINCLCLSPPRNNLSTTTAGGGLRCCQQANNNHASLQTRLALRFPFLPVTADCPLG
ncbi:Uncharacterised protein [Serratia marcescens]|uniref:hypothetical protein n=1 Tax=Serratia marcescens TaxID=615 RepID=UPI0007455413|nr:hypothetical protein [Serratia marcescens]CUZ25616.1 Uncharacterised protein [Serratia marcescens]